MELTGYTKVSKICNIFGTILAEYIVATPWTGPKDDREAALVAAREYSG